MLAAAANAPGRFLARTLNRLVDGADAKSDLSWAFLTGKDARVTFLSEAFFSDILAAAEPVGRLIRRFSEIQIKTS